jgi:hypothetical protein
MQLSLQRPARLLLVALGLGLCAERLFWGRALGLSAPLFVALCLGALLWLGEKEERCPTRANLWLGGAALIAALLMAVRDAPPLWALNMLAGLGSLLLLVAHFRSDAVARLSGWRVLAGAVAAGVLAAIAPIPQLIRGAGDVELPPGLWRRALPVARGLLLAAPVLGCFGLLLVSADEAFASIVLSAMALQLPFDVALLGARSVFALAAAWCCAGALLVALGGDAAQAEPALPAEGDTRRLQAPGWRLGAVEALTVLALVDALFLAFVLVQGAYLFGGLDLLDRTGMTYSEYARRGFFELVAVACGALALLWALAAITGRAEGRQRRAFNAASAVMIALVLAMLASAFSRMQLYEQAYGFTRLRVYTHSFMVWLAAALLLFLAALLRDRPRWFSTGALVGALLYAAALNAANPDALIVRLNVARYQESGKLDAEYLATLSADAAPELAAALPSLAPADRAIIAEGLRARREGAELALEGGWPSWHWARWRAANT